MPDGETPETRTQEAVEFLAESDTFTLERDITTTTFEVIRDEEGEVVEEREIGRETTRREFTYQVIAASGEIATEPGVEFVRVQRVG